MDFNDKNLDFDNDTAIWMEAIFEKIKKLNMESNFTLWSNFVYFIIYDLYFVKFIFLGLFSDYFLTIKTKNKNELFIFLITFLK